MLLKNKTAVIYGGGGAIGGSIARAFAREGAKVFLAGRTHAPLDKVVREILSAGGEAEMTQLDALDEAAIDNHLAGIVKRAGKIDISINATGVPQQGVQGIPLIDLSPASFLLPVTFYTTSNFLTAKAAARVMAEQGSGLVLMLTANPSEAASPFMGGMSSAWSSIEALTRNLACELGSRGVRSVCIRSAAIPETATITEVFTLHAKARGLKSHEEVREILGSMTLLQRFPTLSEVAETATFLASPGAGAITGTVIKVCC